MASDISNTTKKTDTNSDNEPDEEMKKLLVRKVARAVKKNFPVKIFMQKLQYCWGYQYSEFWTQMVRSTTNKLKNLLETNDLMNQSDTTMQLTETEWLLYDLVLVHQNINVIDNNNNKDIVCLMDLFGLVQWHDVENLTGDKLAKTWIHLTMQYNTRGRKISPMLLQQRWYQLKKMSRKHVFDPIEGLSEEKISMLHSIAIKYQKIITEPFRSWELLIKQKRILLPEQFLEVLNQHAKWKLEAHEPWYIKIEIYDSLTNVIGKDHKIDGVSCKNSKDPLSADLPKDQSDNNPLKQGTSKEKEQYLEDIPKPKDLPKDQRGNDLLKQVIPKEEKRYLEDIPKPIDLPKDQLDNDLLKQVIPKKEVQYLGNIPEPIDLPKDQRGNDLLKQVIPKEEKRYLEDIPKPIDLPKDQLDNDLLKQVIPKKEVQYLGNIPEPIDLPKDQLDNDPLKQVISKEKEQHLVDLPKSKDLPKDQLANDHCKQVIPKEKEQCLEDLPKSKDLPKDQLANDHCKQVIPKEKEQCLEDLPKSKDLPKDQCDNDPFEQVISKEKEQCLEDLPKPIDLPKDQRGNNALNQVKPKEKEQHLVDLPISKDLPKDQLANDHCKQVIPKEKEQCLEDLPKSKDLSKGQLANDHCKQVIPKEKEQCLEDLPKSKDLPKDQRGNDPFKQVISKEKEQYLENIPKPMSKNKDKLSLAENIIENTADDIEDKMNKDTSFGGESSRQVTKRKTEFLNKDIELIDGNKKKRKKKQSNTARARHDKDGSTNKHDTYNDPKLRMKAIVSTRKLDTMKVFKHSVYDFVKDKKVIEYALSESKPIFRPVSRDKHGGVAQKIMNLGRKMRNIQTEDDMTQDANVTTNKSLNSPSRSLRKSRNRTYTKQFLKNPNFNIELKKLTPSFFSSTSNRILFEKCIPVTIDVHRDLELDNELINGKTKFKNVKKFKSTNAKVTKKVYIVGMESNAFRPSDKNVSKDTLKKKHDPQKDSTQVNRRTSTKDCERKKRINKKWLTADMTPTLNASFSKLKLI